MTLRHSLPLLVLLTVVAFSALPGCGGESPATPVNAAADGSASNSNGDGAEVRQVDHEQPVVRIETSQGAITVRLDAVNAPGTVRNFLDYANEGFYDNTLVHYVDPGNMLVAGGYSADRQPKSTRLPIRNEAHNGLKNVRGTVAMTRAPDLIDSATSQFFINLSDAPQRDHQGTTAEQYGYCVFGEVIEGLDVAQQISQSSTASLDGDFAQTPQPAVVVQSVRLVR
jgi:cyclophilin family peptidyl-prolyl cis-trans isomerase